MREPRVYDRASARRLIFGGNVDRLCSDMINTVPYRKSRVGHGKIGQRGIPELYDK